MGAGGSGGAGVRRSAAKKTPKTPGKKTKTKTTKARKPAAKRSAPRKAAAKSRRAARSATSGKRASSARPGATLEEIRRADLLHVIPRVPPAGRFGPQKVFASVAWSRMDPATRPSLPEFKRWLVDLNRQGAVRLARADLIGAMDPTLVEQSEIHDRGATFHFVIDETSAEF